MTPGLDRAFRVALYDLVRGRTVQDASPLLSSVLDLDWSTKMGITLTLGDISAVEFEGLRLLHLAREKRDEEDAKIAERRERGRGRA